MPPEPIDAAVWRDLRLANRNACLWAIGNGLISTTLVTYLALEFGAKGLAISLILAAPRFAGVLRVLAPAMVARARARRAVCVVAFASSTAALAAMLVLATPGRLPTADAGVAALTIGWCFYHVLEYAGTVLLWSWLGDLMPAEQRGVLIGRRERWLVVGRVIGIGVSFLLAIGWARINPDQPRWTPLIYSAAVGTALMAVAAIPLARMRPTAATPSALPRATWATIRRCLADRSYSRLLTYSCAFALANGLTGVAQSLYPYRVLGVRYEHMLMLRAVMRSGQAAVAPRVGSWIDRFGAKRLMFVAQLIVATGPLFFLFASESAPWWIIAAFVAWIAYAGLNVGLDHQKLAVAPPDNNAPAIAAYHAISDLANGVMIVLGGYVFDRLTAGGEPALALYAKLFLCGWVARTLVAGLILRLSDPLKDRRAG
ncbi:MAG: MFS transporter [Planctomycetota bacterium]